MKTLALLEITCPDHFRGYHRAVLQVRVSDRMTHMDLANELGYEYESIHDCMRGTHSKTELLIIEQCIADIQRKGNKLYFDNTDVCDDVTDQYFYFGLINPVYGGGLMFCE